MFRTVNNIKVQQFQLPPTGPQHRCKLSKPAGGPRILQAGVVYFEGHAPLLTDILLEQDIPIPMRDGETIFADVYRPANTNEKVPAIICNGPYGKTWCSKGLDLNNFPWRFGCPKLATTGLETFEGLDPGYWCRHHYAIVHPDTRGTWNSTGDVTGTSDKEGEDNYDIIEYLAAQPWCNGKVSMAGNSYLAITQWFAGATNPPHLACLAPWEGFSSKYDDVIRIGGSPDPGFTDGLYRHNIASFRGSKGDDMIYMCYEYPVWNDYWDFIRPKLEKINCPLYIVAGWTNPLHVNGTFRAWETISSNEKWLRVHNTHEWPDLYDPANVEDLRKFYNYYLKDVQNDWVFTPRVRLSVLNAGGSDIVNRPEKTFPLKRQQEYKIYLNPETMELSPSRPEETMTFSHDAITGSSTFIFPFSYTTEFVGHSKLRLWGSTTSSNDMDIFVHLQKFDAVSGLVLESVVTNVGRLMDNPAAARKELLTGRAADPSFCNEYFYSGPRGRLRASHRALDLQKSTSLHPVYTHTEEQLLSPGEVVCLDIDIWPYGWVFEKGQELRLTISGFNTKPHLGKVDKQPRLRNQGAHVFYGGGRYDSFLLLPLIPQAEQFSV